MIELMMLAEAEHEILPESFMFLHTGWFAVHIIAIALVFWAGFKVGQKNARKAQGSQGPAA